MSPLVLILNDEQNLLDLYQLLLEEEGYTVHTSAIMVEDVRHIETLHPALVILDLKFGAHYSGLNLLQQLKMYPATKHIPVIVCTAAVEAIRSQETVLRLKGVPIVYKPFDLDELLKVIRAALPARSVPSLSIPE